MADKEVRIGDKYIIEIGSTFYSPQMGNRYFIKGFDSLVMTDIGLAKLKKYEEPPKEVPHLCENCKYRHRGRRYYPCSLCENNYDVETEDMFVANGK